MTLKELLAIDEGVCPGCPVCQPRTKPRRAGAYGRRSVSFPVRSNPAVFSVSYTDARTDPTKEEGVVIARTP
ncbi:MAG: hypothetical protein M3Q49_19725 [Actinomycetota bacterium]|nr:hypothetical protein [Actinomycetota bacterium]